MNCGRSPAIFQRIGCWWRPTRRTSRRCRSAASATNRPIVAHTARVLAEVRGLEPEALADLTTANFRRLFRKAA